VSSDLRDCNFATQRFEYGAQRDLVKHEIVMHLRIRPTITTHVIWKVGTKESKCLIE
jgi:hypothetical protein